MLSYVPDFSQIYEFLLKEKQIFISKKDSTYYINDVFSSTHDINYEYNERVPVLREFVKEIENCYKNGSHFPFEEGKINFSYRKKFDSFLISLFGLEQENLQTMQNIFKNYLNTYILIRLIIGNEQVANVIQSQAFYTTQQESVAQSIHNLLKTSPSIKNVDRQREEIKNVFEEICFDTSIAEFSEENLDTVFKGIRFYLKDKKAFITEHTNIDFQKNILSSLRDLFVASQIRDIIEFLPALPQKNSLKKSFIETSQIDFFSLDIHKPALFAACDQIVYEEELRNTIVDVVDFMKNNAPKAIEVLELAAYESDSSIVRLYVGLSSDREHSKTYVEQISSELSNIFTYLICEYDKRSKISSRDEMFIEESDREYLNKCAQLQFLDFSLSDKKSSIKRKKL